MNRPEELIRVLPPFLCWSPDGEVRISGRRIGLFHIITAHRELGADPAKISADYELTPELVTDVLAFADQHHLLVDPYVAEYQAELDRNYAAYQPSPAALRIQRQVAERNAQVSRPSS
jgi:uncharacterized protein (DUF433 family)